jgi:hypothetical protein
MTNRDVCMLILRTWCIAMAFGTMVLCAIEAARMVMR